MSENLKVTRSLTIPASELKFTFSTSGGPGGQHANKVATRAEVSWNVDESAVASSLAVKINNLSFFARPCARLLPKGDGHRVDGVLLNHEVTHRYLECRTRAVGEFRRHGSGTGLDLREVGPRDVELRGHLLLRDTSQALKRS